MPDSLEKSTIQGEVRAKEDAVLGKFVIRPIDWIKESKLKAQKAKTGRIEKKKEDQPTKDKAKIEFSVEELVGKKVI